MDDIPRPNAENQVHFTSYGTDRFYACILVPNEPVRLSNTQKQTMSKTMNDFLLLIRGDDRNASPAQMQKMMQRYQEWMQKWRSKDQYVNGSPLRLEGIHVKNSADSYFEGTFLDASEAISGFIWIRASSLDQAHQMALECPLLDNLEIFIRPFLKIV